MCRHTVIDFFEVTKDPLCWIFALVCIRNLSFGVLAHPLISSPRIHRLLLLPELGSGIEVFKSLNRQSANCFVGDRLIACRFFTKQPVVRFIYLPIHSSVRRPSVRLSIKKQNKQRMGCDPQLASKWLLLPMLVVLGIPSSKVDETGDMTLHLRETSPTRQFTYFLDSSRIEFHVVYALILIIHCTARIA